MMLAVYAVGHPVFEGARPAMLDKPLVAFHRDVNAVAKDGLSMFGAIEGPSLAPVGGVLREASR